MKEVVITVIWVTFDIFGLYLKVLGLSFLLGGLFKRAEGGIAAARRSAA